MSTGGGARVVLVTGEPGSGKTTVGVAISRALQVPFLARDDVRRGMYFTRGAWTGRPGPVPTHEEAVDAFLRIVERTTSLGVSCVVEYVVRQADDDALRRLTAAAACVVVLTECGDALRRAARRDRDDRLLNRRPVLDALGYATIDDQLGAGLARMASVARRMRTEFDLPVLRVRTDDGYEPALEAILAFVTGS
jgi:predicted kinase